LSLGLLTAGMVSPWVGRAIAQRGGRPVLAVSAGLLASGLLALSLAHSLPIFLMAWLAIGLGMGAGLGKMVGLWPRRYSPPRQELLRYRSAPALLIRRPL
jgi:MFS family permease